MEKLHLSNLKALEAESIHIIREVFAEFRRPVMLYSVGKDSSVMVRLAQKAFHPVRIPFPLLHVDTGMKFPEMYEFRDRFCREIGADLRIYRFEQAIAEAVDPWKLGTVKCCAILKTQALLNALEEGGYDAAFGGARRDEEKSRAKEREMVVRDGRLIPVYEGTPLEPGEKPQSVMCRFRTLGCHPCTGAVRSTACTVEEIVEEMMAARHSERITRLIDHDQDSSMEQKKREGYF